MTSNNGFEPPRPPDLPSQQPEEVERRNRQRLLATSHISRLDLPLTDVDTILKALGLDQQGD